MKITASISTILVILALAGWGLSREGGSLEPEAAQPKQPKVVLVAPVLLSATSGTRRFSTMVRARQRAQLAFAVPGRLTQRLVEVGDKVEAGQLLARLDAGQFRNARNGARAAHREANARLAQLNRDKLRVSKLVAAKSASREELEKVSAALESVEALVAGTTVRVDESKRLLGDTRIVAPFTGTITAVYLEPGEYAQPGRPVVVLTGQGDLEAELELPESALAGLKLGDHVDVHLPILGVSGLSGTIRSIGHSTVVGRLFPVVVSLNEHEALMPGVTAELHLKKNGPKDLSAPIGAIADPSGSGTFVYRVKEGRAQRVRVHTKGLVGDRVLLEGALEAGDSIIVAGHNNLSHGQAVDPQPYSSSALHQRGQR